MHRLVAFRMSDSMTIEVSAPGAPPPCSPSGPRETKIFGMLFVVLWEVPDRLDVSASFEPHRSSNVVPVDL